MVAINQTKISSVNLKRFFSRRKTKSIFETVPGFDPDYYTKRYSDVASNGFDPLVHYLLHGRHEHRDPNANFNAVGYVLANPDVASSGLDPLDHFLRYGLAAGYKGWERPRRKHDGHRIALPIPVSKGADAPFAREVPPSAETLTPPVTDRPRESSHPYGGLPDFAFWKSAVGSRPLFALDPMEGSLVPQGHKISRSTRVATAGSCFSQHIANRLRESGYDYFVSEPGPPGIDAQERRRRGYGVFSARYGNIYSARQLRQLFERAYGMFQPVDRVWQRSDGRYVDPFRPRVEPDGYPTAEAVEADREAHLTSVRHVFERLDLFVFTLGLTEAWRSVADGAVFPLGPGVAGGTWDPSRYEFVNFSVAEVTDDLRAFTDHLKAINPDCRIILTVSPVPLAATYEKRHVLQSSMMSKAVLRVAAQSTTDDRNDTIYFPSFEIINSVDGGVRYFANDLRSINKAGVDHVMRVFFVILQKQKILKSNCVITQVLWRCARRLAGVMRSHFRSTAGLACDSKGV